MRLNIFEGTRRVTKAIAIIWVASVAVYAWFEDPFALFVYRINWIGEAPQRGGQCDDADAERMVTAKSARGREISVRLCFAWKESENGEKLIPYRLLLVQLDPASEKLSISRADGSWDTYDKSGYKINRTTMQVAVPTSDGQWALYDLPSSKDDTEHGPWERYQNKAWLGRPYSSEVMSYTEKVAGGFALNAQDAMIADDVWQEKKWSIVEDAAKVGLAGLAVLWVLTWFIGWVMRGFLGIPRGRDS